MRGKEIKTKEKRNRKGSAEEKWEIEGRITGRRVDDMPKEKGRKRGVIGQSENGEGQAN